MEDKIKEQIEGLVMPFIEELSVELVELQVKHHEKTVVIDIIADKPSGGITIGECTSINKKVDRAIEDEQWFGENYTVRVSSPGLDRSLKTQKDFIRVLGRTVRFHLLELVEGKVEHSGEVIDAKEGQILIKKNDKIITIPLELISKAVQVIE